jgi:hypothetical protein
MASAIRKPLTRNAGQIDPTPSLQQNAERSAVGMTRECDPRIEELRQAKGSRQQLELVHSTTCRAAVGNFNDLSTW